ncbi:hypothetical protein GQ55_9G216000 [Panicum hallii var. hallii]|uniref:Uncharacterized protein n=1 Tax=Panicum hallii var. hallii TaxID=1504633 RepID=A0A2T7C5Q8_9POAL|nr:hypothetical protein GQ55_9G216000 [Panicum hallii var. hallii]
MWKIPTTSPKTSNRVSSCTQSCLWLKPPLEFRMAQDSDDSLFVASVVVWVLVVILAIVAPHCPLPRRVVR